MTTVSLFFCVDCALFRVDPSEGPDSCISMMEPSALCPPVMFLCNIARRSEYPLARDAGDNGVDIELGETGEVTFPPEFRRVPPKLVLSPCPVFTESACFGPLPEFMLVEVQPGECNPECDCDRWDSKLSRFRSRSVENLTARGCPVVGEVTGVALVPEVEVTLPCPELCGYVVSWWFPLAVCISKMSSSSSRLVLLRRMPPASSPPAIA